MTNKIISRSLTYFNNIEIFLISTYLCLFLSYSLLKFHFDVLFVLSSLQFDYCLCLHFALKGSFFELFLQVAFHNLFPNHLSHALLLQPQFSCGNSELKLKIPKKYEPSLRKDIIAYHTALVMYDYSQGKLPEIFDDMFTLVNRKMHHYRIRLAFKSSS